MTRKGDLGVGEFLKRNSISLIILMALGIILGTNLERVVAKQLFESMTRSILRQEIEASAGSHLAEVRFDSTSGTTIIRAVVRGPDPPSAAQVAAIEAKLPISPEKLALELRVRFVQTLIINRSGRLFMEVEPTGGE